MDNRAKNASATARLAEGLRCEVTGALGSCTATVIAMRAAKLGVALETLEGTVESDSDIRGLLGLDCRNRGRLINAG